jgi:hypothetical protein
MAFLVSYGCHVQNLYLDAFMESFISSFSLNACLSSIIFRMSLNDF